MLKGAWILPLMMVLVLLPALAYADGKGSAPAPSAPAFRDLPGVVPEKDRVTAGPDDYEDVTCETGIGFVRQYSRYDDVFGHDRMPTRVYRCESKGVTYTGTQPPSNRPWVPGINPYFLPEH